VIEAKFTLNLSLGGIMMALGLLLGRVLCFLAAAGIMLTAPTTQAGVERPLVLIPGILGSTLVDSQGKTIWGDVRSLSRLDRLTVQDGPRDPDDGLQPAGIIQNIVLFGPLKIKQYSTLRATLEELGYEAGKTYFEFAYDWRKSNFTTAKKFEAFVASTPALKGKPFDIIAHSMGGLVAEIYVKTLDTKHQVVRVINMAVPFLGSVNTFFALTDGWGPGANMIIGGMSTIRRFALSFPSFYELLPRYDNCCVLGLPGGNRDVYELLTSTGWAHVQWLDDPVSPNQEARLKTVLADVNRLRDLAAKVYPNPKNVYNLVGGKVNTRWQYYVDPAVKRIVHYSSGSGDGTVPEGSAANRDVDRAFVSLAQHQTIFDDEAARTTLRRILRRDSLPDSFAANTYAAVTREGRTVEVASVGLEVFPPVLAPRGEAMIEVKVTGKRDVPLDQLNVTLTAEGPVDQTFPIQVVSADGKGIYRAVLKAGSAPGIIKVQAKVSGLSAGLEDYAIVIAEE
jgi:pimeloyl-ACP methyl ester carboxylesterase